ncbi:MAG: phosphoesterase, partial [Gordonia sp. (in: high G+C Gram-positive bacteria)]
YQKSLSRPIATVRAALHVVRHSEPVKVTVNGAPATTQFFFIGSSMYGTAGFFPGRRTRLDDGLIDVRYLDTGHRFETLRLAASLVSGRIRASRLFQQSQVPEFLIESDTPIQVAHDGEAGDELTRAHFRLAYRALKVYGTSVVQDA